MGAVVGGKTAQGEHLYIGRARHQNTVTVGKVKTLIFVLA